MPVFDCPPLSSNCSVRKGGGGLAPVTDQSSSFPKETPFRASIAHFLDNSLPSQDSFIVITTGPHLLLQLIYFQWIHVYINCWCNIFRPWSFMVSLSWSSLVFLFNVFLQISTLKAVWKSTLSQNQKSCDGFYLENVKEHKIFLKKQQQNVPIQKRK